ncbi:YciI family protein [Longimicrobium sp.]|uniref:YciI family protein n=1 Tax=Longimicrobium sp. TaxID=2029185 RepID=UPI003B3A1F84
MRFLSIYKTVERTTPPTPEEMAEMGAYVAEAMASGAVLATEGCLPTAFGARIRREGNTVSVTDGPFAEAKEVVGGFAILQADSLEEAIEMGRRFIAVAGDGECEIRRLYEEGDFDAPCITHAELQSAAPN